MNYLFQKILISLVLAFGVFLYASAQLAINSSEVFPSLKYQHVSGSPVYYPYVQVQGSAYLSEGWETGIIMLTDGEIIEPAGIKLDIHSHEVVIYHKILGYQVKLDRENIQSIVLNTSGTQITFEFVPLKLVRLPDTKVLLGEQLAEGKIQFYKVMYKEIIPSDKPTPPQIDKFYTRKNYALSYADNYNWIALRKRSIVKQFPSRKEDINTIIREKKLRVKEEKDFIELIHALNQMPD